MSYPTNLINSCKQMENYSIQSPHCQHPLVNFNFDQINKFVLAALSTQKYHHLGFYLNYTVQIDQPNHLYLQSLLKSTFFTKSKKIYSKNILSIYICLCIVTGSEYKTHLVFNKIA